MSNGYGGATKTACNSTAWTYHQAVKAFGRPHARRRTPRDTAGLVAGATTPRREARGDLPRPSTPGA
ncbi:hypothetical protein AB0K70_29930, partial [Streptomyces werraensis]